MSEDPTMIISIEVLRTDDVSDSVEGVVVEEQSAEQRLLGFYGVRGNPKLKNLFILRSRAYRLRRRHLLIHSPKSSGDHTQVRSKS
jgi:hypothetical protein